MMEDRNFIGLSDIADLYDWLSFCEKNYQEPLPKLDRKVETF